MLMTITVFLAAIVLWSAVCAVNRMTSKTNFVIRLAYIALATGSLAQIVYPFVNVYTFKQPSLPNFLLMFAIAAMVVWDRRRSFMRRLK